MTSTMTQQFYNQSLTTKAIHNHQRFLHYDSFIRKLTFTLLLLLPAFAKGDGSRPSDVSGCISYNATGFPHLNLQWKDSGIDGVENVHIYYSVNEGDQTTLMLPYQSSNSLTDIVLPGIQNGDDVSVQISVENASRTTERSDKIQIHANALYSVKWFFLPQNNLYFICTLACRSSFIRGCMVSLSHEQGTTSKQSEELLGTIEDLSGRESFVQFASIPLNNSISYSAIALISDDMNEFGNPVDGNVSRGDTTSTNTISSTISSTLISSVHTAEVLTATPSATTSSSSVATDTATPSATTTSNMATPTVSNIATPKVPTADSNKSSGEMVSKIVAIGIAVVVVVLIIIAILLVLIACKLRNNRRNNAGFGQKSFKINKATFPVAVKERMVSIRSEASNLPEPNPYEETDIDIPPPELFETLEPCLHSHYETQLRKQELNAEQTAHTSSYLSTDNLQPSSNYNRLVYSRSEDDDIAPPLLNNYNQLDIQTHNYDEVSLDNQVDKEIDRSLDYVNVITDESSS